MRFTICVLIICIIISILLIKFVYRYCKFHQLKSQIFPYFINDVKFDPKYYNIFKKITENIENKFEKNEYNYYLNYLTKYKTFVDQSNVYSMASVNEIDQIYNILTNILDSNTNGDIVEIGVWKGGMSMWMKAILNYYNSNKKIYLFDTFKYFPIHNEVIKTTGFSISEDPIIENIIKILYENMSSVQQVKNNFDKFNLLDSNIKFVEGDIKDTIKKTNINNIALLRLDTDTYDSILFSLENYYFNIIKGGYVIIDDYNNSFVLCKKAVDYFREKYNITNEIQDSDKQSIYWKI
jgi:O-methyltransferase